MTHAKKLVRKLSNFYVIGTPRRYEIFIVNRQDVDERKEYR